MLDWLATELVQEGWSLKKIHRLMVTSATYRQSPQVTPALLERDPQNELYTHGPRFRMDAEMIRDSALTVAGLLSPKMYGPSVFPPQPEGLLEELYVPDHWTTSQGEDRYRRGLYTFWKRILTYPSFTIFDAPSRENACVRRTRTNTPLQALNLINDPVFLDALEGSRRILAQGGPGPEDRIAYGFRLCVARRPKPKELESSAAFWRTSANISGQHPELARGAISGGEIHLLNRTPPTRRLDNRGSRFLNLDETITRP